MKIVETYSHLNGFEFLAYRHPELWEELQGIIVAVDAEKCRTKRSKEKRTFGTMLYSPVEMNLAMKEAFGRAEWTERRTGYWVTANANLIRKTMAMTPPEQKAEIEAAGQRPIGSYNQTDFVKKRVAVEVQFGKYSFVAYDLFVKHMAFYVGDVIDVGVEILPMKSLQANMSSGVGYYEGELYNVIRQGRGVPAVPLVIIGVAP